MIPIVIFDTGEILIFHDFSRPDIFLSVFSNLFLNLQSFSYLFIFFILILIINILKKKSDFYDFLRQKDKEEKWQAEYEQKKHKKELKILY